MVHNNSLSAEDKWKSEILDDVFVALAKSQELSKRLVYKGARVLRLLLGEQTRASLDIDASLNITANTQTTDEELELLRKFAHNAAIDHFESCEPIRYELVDSTIENRRKSGNEPRGWNVYWLELVVRDLAGQSQTYGDKQIRIDIASPEKTSENSITQIEHGGHLINVITLERMAGEKLRAFLSSLPCYRNKLGHRIHPPRVKDLYDIARILRKRPINDELFWKIAGQEFLLACESRSIDCHGIDTFKENWDSTRKTYEGTSLIPKDVSFNEVEQALGQIVAYLTNHDLLPCSFDLPSIVE